MNVYVVMSWSARTGEQKCVNLNMNVHAAQNAAYHAVENYIRFTGTGGAVINSDDNTEFWPEEAPDSFRVKIDTLKLYVNFANR